jgi:hypothetical protein
LSFSADSFTIEPVTSFGYHDLLLADHDSASEKSLYLYRFRKGRYRLTACYNYRSWSLVHRLSHPLITRTSCK